ncbi:MAG: ATP-binding protein [Candidatus Gracilibacteria bacterium]|nr:ATP-binding protein [Candidatus Gracilibacteria bacterium]
MTFNKYLIDFQKGKLLEEPIFFQHKEYISLITQKLNQDNMIILSGLKHVGKTSLIKEFLTKSGQEKQTFYYNHGLNVKDNISCGNDLINSLNNTLEYNNNINIIVLQNFNKIKNIKDFIHFIYAHNKKFKIILLGNTIKISGVHEVELLTESVHNNKEKHDLEIILYYGLLPEILLIQHKHFKKKFLDLIVNDIFTKEIFLNLGVKSIDLYKFTISYMSKSDLSLSLRELHKGLSLIKQITLKTTIDYVDFSIQVKILKPVYRYDYKKDKIISSRVKYYFTDTGIRNSISQYTLSEAILKENLLFQELSYNGYTIYSGMNGTFDFTFLVEKNSIKTIFHYSKQTDKTELKKEINKLNKIPGAGKRYLIIDKLEDFQIKKIKYENVEIIEYENIFERIHSHN